MDKPAQKSEAGLATPPAERRAPSAERRLHPTSPERSDATTETTATLRQAATDLGIVRLGFASPQSDEQAQDHVENWRDRGYHGTMSFMENPRQSPEELMPGVRSVIVAAVPTETPTPPNGRTGYVAAYARGDDYHKVLKSKLWQLAQVLCDTERKPIRARVCVDTAPILEREWARRAGVTFTGKSTMAIAPGVGTTLLLGLLLTDVDLTPSARLPDGCGTCTLCLDACPTRAFPAPFVLDARRCIAYLTIEHKGEIPTELRPQVGAHVFGCDICQQVCPYNASRKRPAALTDLCAAPDREKADLISWLRMTSGDYRRLTRHSSLGRTSRTRLQRNAAIALGNALNNCSEVDGSFFTLAVEALRDALMEHPNPSVRSHAAWALGKAARSAAGEHNPGAPPTPGSRALDALRCALQKETDREVARELRLALEREGVLG